MVEKFQDEAIALNDIANSPDVTGQPLESGSQAVNEAKIKAVETEKQPLLQPLDEAEISEKSEKYASFTSKRITKSINAEPDEQEVMADALGLLFGGLMRLQYGALISTILVVGVGSVPFWPRLKRLMSTDKEEKNENASI